MGSVLPICDRFVFAVGESEDDTRARVASIDGSAMAGGKGGTIEIIDTRWPDVQIDGTVLAIEANKAMEAAERVASDDGLTWGFYIQADEVIHERDLPRVAQAMQRNRDQREVKALLFRYLHFHLDYQTTDPWMYHKASRVVRLDNQSTIFGDACGPGYKSPPADVLEDQRWLLRQTTARSRGPLGTRRGWQGRPRVPLRLGQDARTTRRENADR